jgi:serine/threonine protein kinase
MIRSYRIDDFLGNGSYGKVYCVKDTHASSPSSSSSIYALKEIPWRRLSNKEKIQLVTEISLQKCSTSPYIIKYYDSFIENDYLYILSEFASFGDLKRYMSMTSQLTDEFIARALIHTSIGLAYLHKHNIVHRDIKMNNILVTEDESIRIADLGVSRFFPETNLLNSLSGSPMCMSPEMCMGTGYNEKTDMWSLGCVVYHLLTGRYPYIGDNMLQLYYRIMDDTYVDITEEHTVHYREWNRILATLLDKNPFTRYRASVICQDLFLLETAGMSLDDVQKQVHMTNSIGENIWDLYHLLLSSPDTEITDDEFISIVDKIKSYKPKKTIQRFSLQFQPYPPSIPNTRESSPRIQPLSSLNTPRSTPSSTPRLSSRNSSIIHSLNTANSSPILSAISQPPSPTPLHLPHTPVRKQSSFLPPIERRSSSSVKREL